MEAWSHLILWDPSLLGKILGGDGPICTSRVNKYALGTPGLHYASKTGVPIFPTPECPINPQTHEKQSGSKGLIRNGWERSREICTVEGSWSDWRISAGPGISLENLLSPSLFSVPHILLRISPQPSPPQFQNHPPKSLKHGGPQAGFGGVTNLQ